MLRIRVKYNFWWFKIFSRWRGVVIYPWVLIKHKKGETGDVLFRHELQHIYQIRNIGWIRYYLTWWWYTIRHGYINNPYEVDARERSYDPLTEEERRLKDES